MLHDIFSKENKKRTSSENKVKIIADIHEKNSLVIPTLIELGVNVETKPLEIGDYVVGEIIIERKTFSDFIASMLSKRLIIQLENMKQYEKKLLILEGKDFERLEKTKLHPNAIRGMILSISLDHKTPVVYTQSSEETASYLYLLAKREIRPIQEINLHAKKGKTKKEKIEYIVESVSNIGPKNAEKLLKKFGSIRKIINAPLNEIEKEIGKKAENFKIVEAEYE